VTETIDRDLERLVERRNQDRDQRDSLDAHLDRLARRRTAQRREAVRWEHIRHHEHMSRLHNQLAEEHAEKARRLES